jgi:hypothetical protein
MSPFAATAMPFGEARRAAVAGPPLPVKDSIVLEVTWPPHVLRTAPAMMNKRVKVCEVASHVTRYTAL